MALGSVNFIVMDSWKSFSKEEILAHFQCQQSGNCCRAEGYVYVTPDDVAGMAAILGVSVAVFRETYVVQDEGWDVVASPSHRPNCFLDSENRCQVYAARPRYCRDYPGCPDVWPDREFSAHLKKCPGLQKAVEHVKKMKGL